MYNVDIIVKYNILKEEFLEPLFLEKPGNNHLNSLFYTVFGSYFV